MRIYKDVLVKKADSFKPDFILISAGFDSEKEDLLGCFKITDSGFEKLTEVVMNIANIHCEGRILSILEGGYNVEGNSSATTSHIKILNNLINKFKKTSLLIIIINCTLVEYYNGKKNRLSSL